MRRRLVLGVLAQGRVEGKVPDDRVRRLILVLALLGGIVTPAGGTFVGL
ncbi:hypothetical protein ACIRL2_46990 [Embleya sp. NPDC127516]